MHLPHLRSFKSNPVIFLTTCITDRRPLLARSDAHRILHEIWTKSAELNGWYVGQYLLMPDHVHLFAARQFDARPLEDWMRLWKSMAATRINRTRQASGAFWQADYFDRYMRSLDDYQSKWDYIALNPVRQGLVASPEVWPYRGIIHDLRYHASRG
jgi:putative transposase